MFPKRDIIFIQVSKGSFNKEALTFMHTILYKVETTAYLSNCVEILDLNKFKVIRKKHLVEQVLRQPVLKAFQFINYLN